MRNFLRTGMIFVLLAGVAAAQQTSTHSKSSTKVSTKRAEKVAVKAESHAEALPTEATVMAFFQRMFGYDPNVVFHVLSVKRVEGTGLAAVSTVVSTPQGQQVMNLFVTPDGQHAITGDMIPFGTDPFAKTRATLAKRAFGATRGPANAPITVVEFADLECPACKQAEPTMEKLYADFPNVKFIFQSFPLESLHPWALRAASYLDCIERTNHQGAWTFIQTMYTHQAEVTEANLTQELASFTKMAGSDPAKIAACAATPDTRIRITQGEELAKDLNITGTPTLFVNGRPITNLAATDYSLLKSIVQFEIDQAKK